MIVARREIVTGRLLLLLLVAITLLPFLSLLSAALHPADSTPLGIEWPSNPQWNNFVDAFNVAQMPALIVSSVTIVLGVVPAAVVISTMAGFAIGHLRIIGGRVLFLAFLVGLTLPFEGIITPLYYMVQGLGILNTKWAIILPLIGLYMPFAVFWMRAHFINMPRELSEAARVDGASTWDLFWRIHVPLASPAVSLPSPSCCPCGRGTSSCWRSCSWRTRCSGPWPARSAPTRATTRPTSRCCALGRC